jgi:hypothetical protein
MYVQYGFLYLILARPKLTVQFDGYSIGKNFTIPLSGYLWISADKNVLCMAGYVYRRRLNDENCKRRPNLSLTILVFLQQHTL